MNILTKNTKIVLKLFTQKTQHFWTSPIVGVP